MNWGKGRGVGADLRDRFGRNMWLNPPPPSTPPSPPATITLPWHPSLTVYQNMMGQILVDSDWRYLLCYRPVQFFERYVTKAFSFVPRAQAAIHSVVVELTSQRYEGHHRKWLDRHKQNLAVQSRYLMQHWHWRSQDFLIGEGVPVLLC